MMPMHRAILLCAAAAVTAAACSGGSNDGSPIASSASVESASAVAPGGVPESTPTPAPTTALAPALGESLDAPLTTTPEATPRSPAIAVAVPCPEDVEAGIECASVEVPADRVDPAAGSVVLPVAIARATGRNPGRRALVVPAGGPGYAGLGDIAFFGQLPVRETHDIVTYDQRGTGRATPSLECPERDEAAIATLQAAGDPADERASVAAAMTACRERLAAAGIDLDDYDSETNAADLDDVREALGYERWTILGISYGARLALASMRSFPDGIESVILDSVYDVTYGGLAQTIDAANRGIDHLAAACAADPSCSSRYPDLATTIASVRERYNATPWEGDVALTDEASPEHFVITGDDIMAGLFQALYDATLVPVLPSILVALDTGDTSIIPVLLVESIPRLNGQADAMALSFDCADNAGLSGVAAADAAVVADTSNRLSTAITTSYVPSCADWGVPPTSGQFNEPVVSPIPALVLAGSFDPITPPAGTEAVASRLERATFALFPAQGHGVTGRGDCQTSIMRAFLADPSAELDTACVAALTGPAWA
ncbi:MAG: alpha/beta fold hydrolase [Acidimicrobiia bacterium]